MPSLLRPFKHTGDGVWAVDTQQRIVFWNQAAESKLGYRAEEAIGQFCYELLGLVDVDGKPLCGRGCELHMRGMRGEALSSFVASVSCRSGQNAPMNISLIGMPTPGAASAEMAALVHLFHPAEPSCGKEVGLRLNLLGPVQAFREDGSCVQGAYWTRAKVRALLVMLALQRSRLAHRDLLLEKLWANLDRPAALRNLNSTVYYLRRSLEPGLQHGPASRYVSHSGDFYGLGADQPVWVDVEAFERGVEAARRAPDSARARALYEDALSLYRGDYLADLDGDLLDCWIDRERLNEHYLNATLELASLYAAEGEGDLAQELCLQVLAVDTCREDAVELLMRLSLRRGDRAAALGYYHRLTECMLRELGLGPSLQIEHILDETASPHEPSPRT